MKKIFFALICLGLGIIITFFVQALLFWGLNALLGVWGYDMISFLICLPISIGVAYYSVKLVSNKIDELLSKLLNLVLHYSNVLVRRVSVPVIALAIIFSSGLFLVVIIQHNSSKNMERAERECVRWFRNSDFAGSDAFVLDTYRKHGSIVVQIGFDGNGSSYTIAPCVYDDGNLTKPGAFDRSYWRK